MNDVERIDMLEKRITDIEKQFAAINAKLNIVLWVMGIAGGGIITSIITTLA